MELVGLILWPLIGLVYMIYKLCTQEGGMQESTVVILIVAGLAAFIIPLELFTELFGPDDGIVIFVFLLIILIVCFIGGSFFMHHEERTTEDDKDADCPHECLQENDTSSVVVNTEENTENERLSSTYVRKRRTERNRDR